MSWVGNTRQWDWAFPAGRHSNTASVHFHCAARRFRFMGGEGRRAVNAAGFFARGFNRSVHELWVQNRTARANGARLRRFLEPPKFLLTSLETPLRSCRNRGGDCPASHAARPGAPRQCSTCLGEGFTLPALLCRPARMAFKKRNPPTSLATRTVPFWLWLLATAPKGGLEPLPEHRFREACSHLL